MDEFDLATENLSYGKLCVMRFPSFCAEDLQAGRRTPETREELEVALAELERCGAGGSGRAALHGTDAGAESCVLRIERPAALPTLLGAHECFKPQAFSHLETLTAETSCSGHDGSRATSSCDGASSTAAQSDYLDTASRFSQCVPWMPPFDRRPESWVEDAGTTLQIRCIPKRLTLQELYGFITMSGFDLGMQVETAGPHVRSFVYVPIDFTCRPGPANKGFAFVHFRSRSQARAFTEIWHQQHLQGCSSPLDVSLASVQGVQENLRKWYRSGTRRIRNPAFRPMLFV